MSSSKRTATVLIAILAVASIPAQGTTLEAVDAGFYNQDGNHSPSLTNYSAGKPAASAIRENRNFYVFDLSGISSPVTSATLTIYCPSDPPDSGDGYKSQDPSETYTLFEVTTDITTLVTGGTGLTGVFDDLGGGIEYGMVDMSAADNGVMVSIPLNAGALGSLNAAAGGLWAVGGAVTTLDPRIQIVFSYTNDSMQRRLIINEKPTIFEDGFESGDTTAWSATAQSMRGMR